MREKSLVTVHVRERGNEEIERTFVESKMSGGTHVLLIVDIDFPSSNEK